MHNALLPAMCCNLDEFTRIVTPESGQKSLEALVQNTPESKVSKKKRVGRPRIYGDVDSSELSAEERRRASRCRANRDSARRVREAKVAQVRRREQPVGSNRVSLQAIARA